MSTARRRRALDPAVRPSPAGLDATRTGMCLADPGASSRHRIAPMASSSRQFAIVTGASSGIGYHLARECAQNGFDLLVAADRPDIQQAAEDLRGFGAEVEALEVDLANCDGVDRLVDAARGRQVDALLANAG